MKRLITMGLLVFTSVATAQFTEEPKLTRDLAKTISPWTTYSVEVVKMMPADTYVTLEGFLTDRVDGSDDKYLFKDESDSVVVEIDDDLWKGQKVSKKTKIKILGEIDRSMKRETFEIDVKYLEIAPMTPDVE